MNKKYRDYLICWILLVSLFNVICFVIPGEEKFEGAFWSGYAFSMGAFLIHAVFIYFEYAKANNNVVTTISYLQLFFMILVSSLCMLIKSIPNWVGVIMCYTILVFSIIFMIVTNNIESKKNY